MVKYIVGMKRYRTMPLEEMNQKWEDDCAVRAVKTPGLRKYNVNFAVDGWIDSLDGFGELWFDDLTRARFALASLEFTETRYFIRDNKVTIPVRMLGEEHPFAVKDPDASPKFRYINYLKKPANMYLKAVMNKIWVEEIVPLTVKTPGITRYVADFGVDEWGDSADGMEEFWFDSLEDAKKGLASPQFIESRRALTSFAIMTLSRNIVEAHKIVLQGA